MDHDVAHYRQLIAVDDFGALRDVYILDTNERDWQRVLDHLRSSTLPLSFRVDGHAAPLPGSVAHIFSLRHRATAALVVDLGGVKLVSHFFVPSEIEFDLDPREFTRDDQIVRLLAFMRDLGNLLDKQVILTPESTPDDVLVRLQPAPKEEPAVSMASP